MEAAVVGRKQKLNVEVMVEEKKRGPDLFVLECDTEFSQGYAQLNEVLSSILLDSNSNIEIATKFNLRFHSFSNIKRAREL